MFLTGVGYSQSKQDVEEYYPMIAFAFGKSLNRSESVKTVADLVKKENWDSLKALMGSSNPAVKYLSIKVCTFASRKGKIILDVEDLSRIEAAKQSDEKITYGRGCQILKNYVLRDLFQNPRLEVNEEINDWIKEIEK